MRNGILATVMFVAFPALCWAADEAYWWPKQALPAGLVTVPVPSNPAEQMMVQSIAGLAARTVNEGTNDEMVWIVYPQNPDYDDWYARVIDYGSIAERGRFSAWALLDRFAAKGVVQGYILYRYDTSAGGLNEHRSGMDLSVNVATSLSGLFGGVLIDESLQAIAEAHGLSLLADVRGKTQQWCFDAYRERFNRRMLFTQDPRKPNARAMAIANKTLALYGYGDPLTEVLEWLSPLSPILGWNGGDERVTTQMTSEYGHIQTATDWCLNLPVMMAGSSQASPKKVRGFNPATIDWQDQRDATTFIMSDGDNVQWYMGGFFRNEPGSWWSSPDRGRFSFGWSCPFAHLRQLSPPIIDYTAETQSSNCWMVEWGGGYYYPDYFATRRSNRRQLLAEQARRTWALMRETNTDVIGFNCIDLDSDAAIEAYQVFAQEMKGLLGIVVFQYYPYEGGAGKVLWVEDKDGVEIPVVSAHYAIWENTYRPLAGTPAKIARLLNEQSAGGSGSGQPHLDWVITHAWSYFKESSGSGDHDEDMPQDNAASNGGVRGLTPVGWCVDRLDAGVRVVSPQELLWRTRMAHNPGQTEGLIRQSVPAASSTGKVCLCAFFIVICIVKWYRGLRCLQ